MKTLVYIGTSLDGFIAKLDGDIAWLERFARKDKVTVLSMKPAELLNYLSSKGFSSLYIDGGKVIQSFLKEDLIDELIISRAPVLIGNGIPLFGLLDIELQFNHLRTVVQSNGLVRSYYERKRISS
jgi:dihydrofolate reductase